MAAGQGEDGGADARPPTTHAPTPEQDGGADAKPPTAHAPAPEQDGGSDAKPPTAHAPAPEQDGGADAKPPTAHAPAPEQDGGADARPLTTLTPAEPGEDGAPAAASALSQDELNDVPLYEGTHREWLLAKAQQKREGGRAEAVAWVKSQIREGQDLHHRGSQDEALEILLRALEVSLDLEEMELVCRCHYCIGCVFCRQEKDVLAVRAMKEAIRLHRAYGHDELKLAGYLEALSRVYDEQGKHQLVLEASEEALSILKAKHGDDHPKVGSILRRIGIAFEEQGRYAQAEERFKESLRIANRALGDEHPKTWKLNQYIGVCAFNQSEFPEALGHWEKAFRILSKARDDEQSEGSALLQFDMALVHQRMGNWFKAKELFGAAARIFCKVYGPEHSRTKEAMLNALACARKALVDHRSHDSY